MLCEACGVDVPTESRFCPKCGERLDGKLDEGGESPTAADKIRKPADGDDDDDEERDLWEGGYSGKALIGGWLGAGALTIGALVVGMMFPAPFMIVLLLIAVVLVWGGLGIRLALQKISIHYKLTTQRFIHKVGILNRVSDRIEVIDIDDVTYEQGLLERLVGVGNIRISSSDRTHPELLLKGIANVQEVANEIDEVRRAERRKRGLHIEAI